MLNIVTRKDLALYYGVCTKTLNRWLSNADIHLRPGHIVPADLEDVFSKLKHPTRGMSHFGATFPSSAQVGPKVF